MTGLQWCFWASVGIVVYAYAIYPFLMGLAARVRGRPVHRERFKGTVSIVVAARNEEQRIWKRLAELSSHLANSGLEGEIILVSDGSTDRTADIGREFSKKGVRVIELSESLGKAAALDRGCAASRNEIVVFADVRQTWASDALMCLLENFADPTIGAVSGDLIIRDSTGVVNGVGMYWRYEKWLRRQESRVYSTVGVSGSISAVRRELFHPIPAGTVLDDVYWPLDVAMNYFRVLHDDRARAYDQLPEHVGDEFRRKVRTLSGNFQLLRLVPLSLLPWRNPVWLQLVSHKVARLVAPWCLLCALFSSILLPGLVYKTAFVGQAVFYAAGLYALCSTSKIRPRLANLAASFMVLNSAAWVAFWVWISGRTVHSWRKVHYDLSPAGQGP